MSERGLEIFIDGAPAPQGSKRHVGHGILVESSKKVKPWREAVTGQICASQRYGLTLKGPIRVEAVFHLPRPKRPKSPAPITYPDLDKLLRSTFDGIVMAWLIEDDSYITQVTASKVYAIDGKTGVALKVFELREGEGN